MLKSPKLLAKENEDSENITYASAIDKYIERPTSLEQMSLTEYTAFYPNNPSKPNKRTRACIIRYVRYNPHIDYENFCQEKIMLYIPFRTSEASLSIGHTSWASAFDTHKLQIARIETKFCSPFENKQGDIDEAAIETKKNNNITEDFNLDHAQEKDIGETKKYDIISDMKHIRASQNMHANTSLLFLEIPHPFVIPNEEYFSLRRQLNEEQQSILKDVLMKKRTAFDKPQYLYLT